MKNDILVLLNSTCTYNRAQKISSILNTLERKKSEKKIMLFFGLEAPEFLSPCSFKIITSERLLSKSDYTAIDEYIFQRLSKAWHQDKQATIYKGINMGKILEYEFQKFLTTRLKNLEIIRKIVEQEFPRRIFVIDDAEELASAARCYCKFKKIPLKEISLKGWPERCEDKVLFFKKNLILWLGIILDRVSHRRFLKVQENEECALIDFKIIRNFGLGNKVSNLIPCLLDRGLRSRLDLFKKGISYLSPHAPRILKFLQYRRKYKSLWGKISQEDNFQKNFFYSDIPIWNLVHFRLKGYFLNNFPKIMANIDLFSDVFKQRKIKQIVLRHDMKETERMLVFAAKMHGVTTLVLQDGILSETNGHDKLIVDRYIAWGKASIEWFRRFGNTQVEFEITGNPKFDNILDMEPFLAKEELCQRLGLDVNKKIILFVPQQLTKFSSYWTDDIFYVMAKKALEASQQFPETQVIIKADPYESISPYEDIINSNNFHNAAVIRNIDIYALLLQTKALITLDSTVALEGMALDIPVIILNLTRRRDRVPYVESGVAIGVYNESELSSAINRVIYDEDTLFRLKEARKKFLEDYAFKIDGNAGSRILNVITIPKKTVRYENNITCSNA